MFPQDTRFLIVDDFLTMRKIMKKVLLELGYADVLEADDGVAALPILERAYDEGRPIGFVISDWTMPQMHGIDLLKLCKGDPRFKSLPFMLVTAETEKNDIREAARAGVSEYVLKPFNSNTLKLKLERCWSKHQSLPTLKAS